MKRNTRLQAALLILSAAAAGCDQSSQLVNPTQPSQVPIESLNPIASGPAIEEVSANGLEEVSVNKDEIYLSDIEWASMSNGWGPAQRDRSNGEKEAQDGQSITLDGHTYAKGLGTHAHSEIQYRLNGVCSSFRADVGVDDEVGLNGSVVFEVRVDGTKIFDSGVMTGATRNRAVIVDVTGRNNLVLIVTDAADGRDYDHADWAAARIACTEDPRISRK